MKLNYHVCALACQLPETIDQYLLECQETMKIRGIVMNRSGKNKKSACQRDPNPKRFNRRNLSIFDVS